MGYGIKSCDYKVIAFWPLVRNDFDYPFIKRTALYMPHTEVLLGKKS